MQRQPGRSPTTCSSLPQRQGGGEASIEDKSHTSVLTNLDMIKPPPTPDVCKAKIHQDGEEEELPAQENEGTPSAEAQEQAQSQSEEDNHSEMQLEWLDNVQRVSNLRTLDLSRNQVRVSMKRIQQDNSTSAQ